VTESGFTAVRRYGRIYAALWRNSVVREMGFKANFVLWIFVELLWFALQLTFIAVIYGHTERIATWSKWEVVLLVGASQFIQQVFAALFLSNCTQLSEYVRTGRLDFLLLLPANTRFLISFRQVDLGAFVSAAAGVAVMAYALRQLHLTPSLGQIASFLPLCAAGILVHYSLMFLLATVCFWTVRAQGIVWSYYNLFNLARLPDAAFRTGWFKAVFTFVLPMLLVANVPVKYLATLPRAPWESAVLLALALLCFAVSEWVWRASVRHYTSASS
jgi:ABC-2 type transport system permease protein